MGPINSNKTELSYNSNFSKQSKRCIWIKHRTHPEFELIFQNWFKSGVPNRFFLLWDLVILDSNHRITIWIQCTKQPLSVWAWKVIEMDNLGECWLWMVAFWIFCFVIWYCNMGILLEMEHINCNLEIYNPYNISNYYYKKFHIS